MLTLSANNSVTLLWENPSRNAGFLDAAPTSPSSPSPRVAPPLALGRFAPDSGASLLRERCCFVPGSCPSCAGFGAVCVKAASAAGACFGIQMCAVVFGNIQGTL